MVVADGADCDVELLCCLIIDLDKSAIPAARDLLMEAIEKSLARAKRLVNPSNSTRQRIRTPRAFATSRAVDTVAFRIMKMRDGDKDFHIAHL